MKPRHQKKYYEKERLNRFDRFERSSEDPITRYEYILKKQDEYVINNMDIPEEYKIEKYDSEDETRSDIIIS